MDRKFKRALVIGTGMMGPGIALTLARGGLEVKLAARTFASVQRGMESFRANLKILRDNDLITSSEAAGIEKRVSGTTEIFEEAASADLIAESVLEDVGIKQELFKKLEGVCPPSTIFTTNTSGIRVSEIAAPLRHPERALTTHFWMPPYLIPLVEVILGDRSSLEAGESVYDLYKSCGKTPVLIRKDYPGQVGNRILHAIIREALFLVQEGICTAEDIDAVIKNSFGLRFPVYGPLEHIDLVGLDMVSAIQTYVNPHLCNVPDCLPILKKLVGEGNLGFKTGQGLYDWGKRDAAQVKRGRDEFIIKRLQERRLKTTTTER